MPRNKLQILLTVLFNTYDALAIAPSMHYFAFATSRNRRSLALSRSFFPLSRLLAGGCLSWRLSKKGTHDEIFWHRQVVRHHARPRRDQFRSDRQPDPLRSRRDPVG